MGADVLAGRPAVPKHCDRAGLHDRAEGDPCQSGAGFIRDRRGCGHTVARLRVRFGNGPSRGYRGRESGATTPRQIER